jgi:uncharacterized protein YwgA/O-acetyl-ADP-ribose deacetylase (regulator of RNase III)
MVKVLIGDIFESKAQTLVNTVNTVGIMGKGIALGFRKHFPEMFEDYVRRCERKQVRLGEPYLYRRLTPPHILNFPTKDHWRSRSNLADIVRGLQYLERYVNEWQIESLAVPPLGCGEGQLEWRVVGPTLYRHLDRLGIPIELYAPFGTPHAELQPEFLAEQRQEFQRAGSQFKIEPAWVALVAILEAVSREKYRWPVGRIAFQKIAYFATEAGIPTGLSYERSSYGPYAPGMKQLLSRLENNGLILERQVGGKMFVTLVGPTYVDAKLAYASMLDSWKSQIERVADLVVRMRTEDAEIAATAHFVAAEHLKQQGRRATELDVYNSVLHWKRRRRPLLDPIKVAMAIRELKVLGWLDVDVSSDLPVPDEAAIA